MIDYSKRFKTLDEITGPYMVVCFQTNLGMLVGNVQEQVLPDGHVILSATAITSYYYIEPGDDISISTKNLLFWNRIDKNKAQFWLNTFINTMQSKDEEKSKNSLN